MDEFQFPLQIPILIISPDLDLKNECRETGISEILSTLLKDIQNDLSWQGTLHVGASGFSLLTVPNPYV